MTLDADLNTMAVHTEPCPEEPDVERALELLGWAQFNLYKGKTNAVEILIRKASRALGYREEKDAWNGHPVKCRLDDVVWRKS